MSLKSKITIAAFLLILVASVGLYTFAYVYFSREFKSEITRQHIGLASEMARQLDAQLGLAQRQMVAVASSISLRDLAQPERLRNVLTSINDSSVFFDAGYSVIDRNGGLLAEYPPITGSRDGKYAAWEYVRESFRTSEPYISAPYRTSMPGRSAVVAITAPIKADDGSVVAVISGRMKLYDNSFIESIGKVKIGDAGYLSLFTEGGIVVMHPNDSLVLTVAKPGQYKVVDAAVTGFEGMMETTNYRGVDGLVMLKHLKSTDWVLASYIPRFEAYGPILNIRTKLIVAIVLVDLVLAALIWLVMARLTAPLLLFTRHIRGFRDKKGMKRLIELDSDNEIGQLANAFNWMVFDLEEQRVVLEEKEQQFRTLVEFAHDLIIWVAPDYQMIYVTPNCRELTGYDDADFYGDATLLERLVHPDDRRVWEQHKNHHILLQDDHYSIDIRFVCRDGTIRWMNHACRLVVNEQGVPAGVRGSFRDISERIILESKLEKEKSFVENLIRNATVPIFVLGEDHRILFWNRACEELTGYPADQMIGTTDQWRPFYPLPRPTIADLLVGSAHDQIGGYYETVRSTEGIPGGFQSEGWFHNLNGRDRYLLFDAAPIRNCEGVLTAVIETLKDITDLKRAEEEVRKLSRVVEQSPNAIVMTDTGGQITYVNPKFTQMTGYCTEEVVGENPRILKGGTPPEVHRELWDSIKAGREWRGEFQNRKKSGEVYWESASVSAFKDQDGKITHFIAIKEDITMRKLQEQELETSRAVLVEKNEEMDFLLMSAEKAHQELARMYAELQAAQAQMLQREKMASIGQLAAGVAHEINNPIGFINSNLGTLDKYVGRMIEFIQAQETALSALATAEVGEAVASKRRKLKLDYVIEDSRKLIQESLDGAERVRKIVQNLKSFSRVDESESKHANLNECLESTLNIVWNELKYKATVEKEYGELPETRCYPQQLNQVFLNLLVNAAHAIDGQGKITIRSWADGTDIFIAISDTGSGIPEEIRNRIFEPFFTTKEVGKGTGLGLSISYDIVRKHGGEMLLDSTVGEGTTFTVKLPVTA